MIANVFLRNPSLPDEKHILIVSSETVRRIVLLTGCFTQIARSAMITLDEGNVLLKPSHRRTLMSRLKRAIRLGDRLGKFVLKISLKRSGRHVEMSAKVSDRFGAFDCRTRQMTLEDAFHAITKMVFRQIHEHALRRAVLATAM